MRMDLALITYNGWYAKEPTLTKPHQILEAREMKEQKLYEEEKEGRKTM